MERLVPGCPGKKDLYAPRAPERTLRRLFPSPASPGPPTARGVIVLTVKLFGETLEAPRTLAVWQ